MLRIFRALLIQAANAVRTFIAFATGKCKTNAVINCKVVGNPLIYNNIVSGFNLDDRINFPYFRERILAANYWEVVWRFKYNGAYTSQGIFGTEASYAAGIAIASSKIVMRIKTANGYSDGFQSVTGTTTLQDQIIYDVKMSYDGYTYKIFLKESGNNWGEPEATINTTAKIIFNQPWNLGWLDDRIAPSYCYSDIYLENSYFKFDDTTVYFVQYPLIVSDPVLLNDGTGTSKYEWSAYPSQDADNKGKFTASSVIDNIKENDDGDTIYMCDGPFITYKAYTDANENNIYLATDKPEFNAELKNINNNGCTLAGTTVTGKNGAYLQTTQPIDFTTLDSWEFQTVYTYKGGGSEPMIFASGPNDYCGLIFLVRSGTLQLYGKTASANSWNYFSAESMNLSMTSDTTYCFKLGYSSTDGYYLDYATAKDASTAVYTRIWSNTTKKDKIYSTTVAQLLNWTFRSNYYYSIGSIDIAQTKFIADGTEIVFSDNYIASPVFNAQLKQMENPEALYQDSVITINSVDYTRNIAKDKRGKFPENSTEVKTGTLYHAYTNENNITDSVYTKDDPISDGLSAWTQPTLTANGTLGGNSFAVYSSAPIFEYPGYIYEPYCAFDNDSNTCWSPELTNANDPIDLIIYNPNPLKVTALHWEVFDYNRRPATWEWYGSNDNETYTLIASGTNTSNDFTLEFTPSFAYKYHKFRTLTSYNYLNAKQITLTARELVAPSTLYDSTLTALDPQPEFVVGDGVTATNLQLGALIVPVHEIHNSMEMVLHIKTNASWPNYCLCASSANGTQNTPSAYFQIYDSTRQLQAWMYSSSWTSGRGDIANDYFTGIRLDLNTEYWFKMTWDGTAYNFYVSTNGTDYTPGNTLVSSTPINWDNNKLYLGCNYNKEYNANNVFKNFYLDGTYIKIDGETIFDGKTAILGVDYTSDGCTVYGYPKNTLVINNTLYDKNEQSNVLVGIDSDISLINNTDINTVIVSVPDTYADKTYHAYTNENDITDTWYVKDSPIVASNNDFKPKNLISSGPLIENNGVYSNFFETGSRLVYNAPRTYSGKGQVIKYLEYVFKVKTGSRFSGSDRILQGSGDNYVIGMVSGQIWWRMFNTTLITINDAAITTNTEYIVKMQYENGVYSGCYSMDNGETWSTPVTASDKPAPYITETTFDIGTRGGGWNYVTDWMGSIDMAHSYININGEVTTFDASTGPSTVYEYDSQEDKFIVEDPQPEFDILEPHLVNANMYGTLTENNGVYSGFGATNYITTNGNFSPEDKPWTIIIKGKFNPINNSDTGYVSTGSAVGFNLFWHGTNSGYKGVGIELSSGGSHYSIGSIDSIFNFVADTFYWMKVEFTGTQYIYSVSTDGTNYIEQGHIDSTTPIYQSQVPSKLYFGVDRLPSSTTGSYIDMKESSITVDGVTTTFWDNRSGVYIGDTHYEPNATENKTRSELVPVTSAETSAPITSAVYTNSDYKPLFLDSFTDYTITRLEVGGEELQLSDLPRFVRKDYPITYVVTYNNQILNYAYADSNVVSIIKYRNTFNVSGLYPGATVTYTVGFAEITKSDETPIEVYSGWIVKYKINYDGGILEEGSYQVPPSIERQAFSVALTPLLEFTITPTPADADVILGAYTTDAYGGYVLLPQYKQINNSIYVPADTYVKWEVSQYGYITQSGIQLMEN